MEQLLARPEAETTEQLKFQSKMMHVLLDFYLDIYGEFKKGKVDEGLKIALGFLTEALILASGSEQPGSTLSLSLASGDLPRAKDFVMDLIHTLSLRIKCQDTFVQTHFQALLTLFSRDLTSLLSDLGLEFLSTFGPSRDAFVIKELKKLYVGYKQRDSLIVESKKSILYSMVMKTVLVIFTESSDDRVMRVGDANSTEVMKEMLGAEDGGLEKFKGSVFSRVETYARIRNVQQFLKNFLGSIMMHVTHNKGP